MSVVRRRLIHLIRSGLGWAENVPPLNENELEVWQLARMHKVATILSPGILTRNEPASLVDEARYLWQLTALRDAYYRKKGDELLQSLASTGIRAFPLKGVELSRTVYPRPGMRAFRDLDLLVRPDQIQSVHDHLRQLRFSLVSTKGPLQSAQPPKGDPVVAASHRMEALSYVKDDLFVEIHPHLLPRLLGEYPLDRIWTSPEGLSPEDRFAHLCFHATRHHFLYGLRQLVDIVLWRPKVRSIDLVFQKLRDTNLLWLAWPAWKLAHEHFPNELEDPGSAPKKTVSFYTKMISKHFDSILVHSEELAGSPIPFVFMNGNLRESIWGSRELSMYYAGKSSFRWKFERPFGLIRRHAPVIRKLFTLAFS